MTTNGIIGCVTTDDVQETDFVDVSKLRKFNNLEQCITFAKRNGSLCGTTDGSKCEYVMYRKGNDTDILREASRLYDIGTKTSINKSLNLLRPLWLSYPTDKRKRQLENTESFFDDYVNQIKQKPEYYSWFENTVNTDVVPESYGGECWIGGRSIEDNKNVLRTGDPNILELDGSCKGRPLYYTTSAGGQTFQDQMNNTLRQKLLAAQQQERKAREDVIQKQAMLEVAETTKDSDLGQLMSNIQQAAINAKQQFETADIRNDIKQKFNSLKEQDRMFSFISKLENTSKDAINKNIDFLKDKKQLSNKMNSDIQTLNWSLQETQQQELLYNKITSTLGILVILFSLLCVGTMVYFMTSKFKLKDMTNVFNKGTSSIKKDAKVLNSIFA